MTASVLLKLVEMTIVINDVLAQMYERGRKEGWRIETLRQIQSAGYDCDALRESLQEIDKTDKRVFNPMRRKRKRGRQRR